MMDKDLDIIVPICFDSFWNEAEQVAEKIRLHYREYGFTKYVLYGPSKGWRALSYPTNEHYIELAKMFAKIKELVQDIPVQCGWYACLTIKTGAYSETSGIGKADGTRHPFSNCPTDSGFRERLLSDIKNFARIGAPAFIMLEDDYSFSGSCYCERHLDMFSRRMGRKYSRENLLAAFSQKDEEGIALKRAYRELMRDTLVDLATDIRKAVDEVNPDILLGYNQSGGADYDGDSTEAITRALAGDGQVPFVRLYGTFYCGVDVKKIPEELYHMLYNRQHMGDDVRIFHESDIYPHNQYFASAKELKAMMAIAYSYGFHGSILFTAQMLKNDVYGKMVSLEKKRFDTMANATRNCSVCGVQLGYDPFWNTMETSTTRRYPLWAQVVGGFGIPYTTVESDVSPWDVTQAKNASHETIIRQFAKSVFLDGEAAKTLCERGYGKLLGVNVGEDMATESMFAFDLGAREVVREEFLAPGEDPKMPIAHAWCPHGNGKGMRLETNHPDCEVITEIFNFKKEYLCPGMTRFHNELGGTVIVMGLTIEDNPSQALYNYTRQNLLRRLVQECNDQYVMAQDSPNLFLIMNENKTSDEMIGMLTLINFSADTLQGVKLHIPEKWSGINAVDTLNNCGEWEEVLFEKNAGELFIHQNPEYCEPIYLRLRK